jgi:hypothetical protein
MAGSREQWLGSAKNAGKSISDFITEMALSRYKQSGTPASSKAKSSIGAASSHTNWVTDPAGAVAEMIGNYPEGITDSLQYDNITTTDGPDTTDSAPAPMDMSTIPGAVTNTGPSEQDIMGKYAGLEGLVNAQPGPKPQTPPGEVDPWKIFAATLAGSFASQISKRPELLDVATENIKKIEARRQAIQDQNAANAMLFDQNQYNRILNIRTTALSTVLEKAIKDGDNEKAAATAERLQKIQDNAIKERQNNEQANLNYRQKMALTASKEEKTMEIGAKVTEAQAKAGSPLEMKDYNSQTIQIQEADPSKLTDIIKVPGFLGLGGDKQQISKQEGFLYLDAGAAVGGTDEVKAVALPRFINRLKAHLKISNEFSKFNDSEAEAFLKNMIKYGIRDDLAINFMKMQGIEIGE